MPINEANAAKTVYFRVFGCNLVDVLNLLYDMGYTPDDIYVAKSSEDSFLIRIPEDPTRE